MRILAYYTFALLLRKRTGTLGFANNLQITSFAPYAEFKQPGEYSRQSHILDLLQLFFSRHDHVFYIFKFK
jgi:hypothetical protein